jgi:hypothetical protein
MWRKRSNGKGEGSATYVADDDDDGMVLPP